MATSRRDSSSSSSNNSCSHGSDTPYATVIKELRSYRSIIAVSGLLSGCPHNKAAMQGLLWTQQRCIHNVQENRNDSTSTTNAAVFWVQPQRDGDRRNGDRFATTRWRPKMASSNDKTTITSAMARSLRDGSGSKSNSSCRCGSNNLPPNTH